MREVDLSAETTYGATIIRVHAATFARAKRSDRLAQKRICQVARKKISDETEQSVPELKWGSPISKNGLYVNEVGSGETHFNPVETRRESVLRRRERLRKMYPELADFLPDCANCQYIDQCEVVGSRNCQHFNSTPA